MLILMGCDSIKGESKDYYNVVKSSEALSKYGFDWNKFSKCLGYKTVPNLFICGSLNYLKCLMNKLKDEWNTSKWRTYYIYIYLRQIIRFHRKWRVIYYNFFGKFVQGSPDIFPEKIYPVFALSICFNTFLTNEYVEYNKKQEYIDYVNVLAKDLLTVFKRIIGRNTWLSPKTKKYALLKLKNINLIIGSPKILQPDPLLNYSNDDAWGNMCKIAYWRYKRFISLEKKHIIDIPTVDWSYFKLTGSQAYVVNAYYTPTQNSIYVPLGYLQKPFIDLDERGIEYNLAHIGYTLAHEMSHSLDDTGSKYDYKGNLNNWWTLEDRKKFNAKVRNVIKQYETFAAYDGIKMDASLSTGEDLADISGLAICEEYLRDFQMKNQDVNPISSLSFQAFFVYIAIQARQKIYSQAIKAQLKINPHPMDKYRVNCPLARLKLFDSVYNIDKTDKMYWPSKDTIW
jgi:putative endopeptidase